MVDNELRNKIYNFVINGEFAMIPYNELRQDLSDAKEDLINCEAALRLGIENHDGISTQYRINENKKQIAIINMELDRRAGNEMLKKEIDAIEDDYSEMQNKIDELNAKIVQLNSVERKPKKELFTIREQEEILQYIRDDIAGNEIDKDQLPGWLLRIREGYEKSLNTRPIEDELSGKIGQLRKQGDKLAEALESVLTATYDSIDEEVQIKGFAALAEWEGDK